MVVYNHSNTSGKLSTFINVALGLQEPPSCNWFCRNIGGGLKWAVSNLGIPFGGVINNLIDAFGSLKEIDLTNVPEAQAQIVENWLNSFFISEYENLLREGNSLVFVPKTYDLIAINKFLDKVAVFKAFLEKESVPFLSADVKKLRDEYAISLLTMVEKVVLDELNKSTVEYEIFEKQVSSNVKVLPFISTVPPFTTTSANYKLANSNSNPVDVIAIDENNTQNQNNTSSLKWVGTGLGVFAGFKLIQKLFK